jgi:hypothetical protein
LNSRAWCLYQIQTRGGQEESPLFHCETKRKDKDTNTNAGKSEEGKARKRCFLGGLDFSMS